MLQNCNKDRILNVFFDSPLKKLDLKEVCLKSGLVHTSAKKAILELIKEGYIKKEIIIKGKRKFPLYFASRNEKFTKTKKIYNEFKLAFSGVLEFLVKELMPNSIILFGSFSQGTDTQESDIDLFVESELKEMNLNKFEKKLNRKINLTFKENINELNKNFLNNLINGRILYGEVSLNEN